jgi:hypothetical protein
LGIRVDPRFLLLACGGRRRKILNAPPPTIRRGRLSTAATERITMTVRELDRLKVIQDVADGKLKP